MKLFFFASGNRIHRLQTVTQVAQENRENIMCKYMFFFISLTHNGKL